MSQHRIIGSEAFERRPFVQVRVVRAGALHRRRGRTILAFVAGAVVALLLAAGTVVLAFAPNGAF